MHETHLRQFHTERWLMLFLATHLILWTLIPFLIRHNLPLDAIEGTIWGHQLEWGYDKNPYLNGWLTALATLFDKQSGLMIYLFSQLSVITCFLAIWQLAKKMLTKNDALIAVLLLENIQYFNFHAIDFNDNTLELSLWALSIYFFYQALRETKSTLAWLLTGLFAGLGVMTKYYTLVLVASLFLFLILHKENRKHFFTLPPYLGLTVFLLVCLPHVVWLFSHDFITVRYMLERTSSNAPLSKHLANHFIFPAQFLSQQLQVLLPVIIPCALLFIGKKPLRSLNRINITSFHRLFLFYAAGMPLLLTLMLSLLFGITLRAGWGMPLLSTAGIIIMIILQPRLSPAKIIGLLVFTFTLLIAEISGYSASLLYSSSSCSANFPGREIANHLTLLWHNTYHTRLEYVGGSRWVGGSIGYYSADHPAVFIELNEKISPWINQQDMQKKGAMYVWEMSQWNDLNKEVKELFLQNKNLRILQFDWHRNQANLAPVKIGVLMIPPQTTG